MEVQCKNISDLQPPLSTEDQSEQSESETATERTQFGREGDQRQWPGGPSEGELGARTSTCPGSPDTREVGSQILPNCHTVT